MQIKEDNKRWLQFDKGTVLKDGPKAFVVEGSLLGPKDTWHSGGSLYIVTELTDSHEEVKENDNEPQNKPINGISD